jgi:hypothetical protein
MKSILIVMLLCGAGWAQNGGVIPPPDIVGAVAEGQHAVNQAQEQAARTALVKQQTQLLKQQAEALKQQNAAPTRFISAVRKPRIDDIDAATGKPRFATYADYEDGKDEWLIEEAIRRFEGSTRDDAGNKMKEARWSKQKKGKA